MSESIETVLMTVSPEVATGFLKKNTSNRPLNSRRATKLARAIQRGEWKVNGDTIRISKSGIVLDGQHRLTGIAESGVTVKTLFVFGLDDDVFDTIDVGGKPRTTSDVLAISGEKHYTILASAARISYLRDVSGNPFKTGSTVAPTVAQIEEFISRNPQIRESASFIGLSRWIRRNIEPSTAAMCHFIFNSKNKEASNEFFSQLESGEGLFSGSPILMLRDRLSEARGGIESTSKAYKAALMFKAFKHYLTGEKIRTLRIRIDGPAPEKDIYEL